MRFTITSRHGRIPDDVKQRAATVLARLAKRATRPTSAHVTFETTRAFARAEIILNAARNAVFVATAAGSDHRTALDRVTAKLRRQLSKHPLAARRRKARAH